MSFYELICAIKMRLSKHMTLNAEVSFDTFGKALGLFGLVSAVLLPCLSLGQPREPLGLKKFVILRHDFLDTCDNAMQK